MEITWMARNLASLFELVTVYGIGKGVIHVNEDGLRFLGLNQGVTILVAGKIDKKEFKKLSGSGVLPVSGHWADRVKKRFDGEVTLRTVDDEIEIVSDKKRYKDSVLNIDLPNPKLRDEEYGFLFGDKLQFVAAYVIDIAEFKSFTDAEEVKLTLADGKVTGRIGQDLEVYEQEFVSKELMDKTDDELNVILDIEYIKYALKAFTGKVTLGFTGNQSPVVITKVEDKNKTSMVIAPRTL